MAVDANSTSRLAVLYREQLIGGRRQKPSLARVQMVQNVIDRHAQWVNFTGHRVLVGGCSGVEDEWFLGFRGDLRYSRCQEWPRAQRPEIESSVLFIIWKFNG